MGPIPIPGTIISFRDAVGVAMELADEFAFANAAAILDERGHLLDMAVVEGIGRTIEPVVEWATGIDGWHTRINRILLISIRPYEVDIVREADLRLYRRAGWAISAAGARLIDWIETDGDLVRSYAYVTCPAQAWLDDPPGERASDGRP